jgi:hypothetical protein
MKKPIGYIYYYSNEISKFLVKKYKFNATECDIVLEYGEHVADYCLWRKYSPTEEDTPEEIELRQHIVDTIFQEFASEEDKIIRLIFKY